MAFGRVCELVVGIGANAVELSGLDIEFDVTRSNIFSENTATFRIYNASQETRDLIETAGSGVVFRAGYEDDGGLGIVFAGSMMFGQTFRSGPDMITELTCATTRSEDLPLKATLVTLSYAPGTRVSEVLQWIADALGLVLYGSEQANAAFPQGVQNGWVYIGPVRGALSYIRQVLSTFNVGLYIDNGELVAYKIGDTSQFSVGRLTYDTGLVSARSITEQWKDDGKKKEEEPPPKRVGFVSMLNYKLKPNALVTIADTGTTQDGVWLLEKVRFFGNNFGGDFNCEGEARE